MLVSKLAGGKVAFFGRRRDIMAMFFHMVILWVARTVRINRIENIIRLLFLYTILTILYITKLFIEIDMFL